MSQRVYAYIDGFNLYYGALRGKPYKWLDLLRFSKRLVARLDVYKVKYFTAPVSELGDPGRPLRQMVFWRALEALYQDDIEIIKGHFRIDPVFLPRARRRRDGRFEASRDRVWVMKPEEKGSDVNLAVHLVNDAWKNLYDVALVISNDSDLIEALSITKNDCGKGVILANPQVRSRWRVAAGFRKLNVQLRRVRESHLVSSQLPDPIPGTNIHKPPGW